MEETELNHYPTIKQGWGIVGICLLAMVVFGFVYVLLNPVIGQEATFLIYYLLSMGTAFWIAHQRRIQWTNVSVYNLELTSAKTIILVSIAAIALQVGVISPIASLIPMPEFMKDIFVELAKQNGVLSFAAIVIAAPLLEELIFRGIILDGFLKRYTPTTSILVSSTLFGVVHLNPWQFVTAFAIGVFSGWVYYKTKNLLLPILIHFANNLAAFVSMRFMDPEVVMDMSLTEMYGGPLNTVLITLGALSAGAICLHLLRLEFMMPTQPDRDNTQSGGSSEL